MTMDDDPLGRIAPGRRPRLSPAARAAARGDVARDRGGAPARSGPPARAAALGSLGRGRRGAAGARASASGACARPEARRARRRAVAARPGLGGSPRERDRLPAGHRRASRPVGGVPHAVPRVGADRHPGAARLGHGAGAAGDQPVAARFAGRRRIGGRGCCWRTWSWCSPRSPSSRRRRRAGDRELIREGMERGGVLSRLRTVVPAGTTPTRGDSVIVRMSLGVALAGSFAVGGGWRSAARPSAEPSRRGAGHGRAAGPSAAGRLAAGRSRRLALSRRARGARPARLPRARPISSPRCPAAFPARATRPMPTTGARSRSTAWAARPSSRRRSRRSTTQRDRFPKAATKGDAKRAGPPDPGRARPPGRPRGRGAGGGGRRGRGAVPPVPPDAPDAAHRPGRRPTPPSRRGRRATRGGDEPLLRRRRRHQAGRAQRAACRWTTRAPGRSSGGCWPGATPARCACGGRRSS